MTEQLASTAVDSSVLHDDFGATGAGGRGEGYVIAQQATWTRAKGIIQLVEMITKNSQAESDVVLDLLGGDGLVNRVVTRNGRGQAIVFTCDASPFMVDKAWSSGIPALLQRAESLLFRNESVGGVLLAYGTHHISPALRHTVAAEAFRVLQPGGVFVLHDFLTGSAVDTWFAKVVNLYSATGHDYSHFEHMETVSYLETAGFSDIGVCLMDDPFIVSGPTKQHAERELGRYLVHMYGLVKLVAEFGEEAAYAQALGLAREIFQYPASDGSCREIRSEREDSSDTWSVTLPREALVCVGRKETTAPPHRPAALHRASLAVGRRAGT